ncbi:hydroxyacylglutathione hydrolase [Echinimonas agarilytica]|uniref:Hydroxyacylglutathione hydrolase n=1 Tax=Echinimonas agarilytica TaxID=1215918 RepID=A0AA41W6D9_9GAMM|nr:hydroxyacylglutathione hydrolase [Echinimonas agarilytica]MCM2679518.1 hydroxyacylglutathione hydrolase [Echinimonas agarilytica]
MQVAAIPAFNDNYIWAIHDNHHLIVVDPGDAAPVIAFIEQHQLQLTTILVTHHHHDHTGGIQTLCDNYSGITVYGPAEENIPNRHVALTDNAQVKIIAPACEFNVMHIPGHTLGHIAYYGASGLFCGDTLFHAGCGRLFEGSPTQMKASLERLGALPAETLVFCTHEYTLANLTFALAVEPDNADINRTLARCQQLRTEGTPTLPTTIAEQRQINPFLRSAEPTLQHQAEQWAQQPCKTPVEVFTQLRAWKDQF